MPNHRRRTVEWLLRAVEMVAVFSALSWALVWVVTHRRSALPGPRSRRAQIRDLPDVVVGPGHRLDSDDPDGAASLERGRRRRHID
jgi:hypothetical protein